MSPPQPNPWNQSPQSPRPPRRGGGRSFWLWLLLAGAALLIGVLFLMDAFPGTLEDRGGQISLVHSLLLLGLVGSSVIVHAKANPGGTLKNAAVWAAIAAALLLVYTVKDEAGRLFDRVAGEVVPTAGVEQPGQSIAFRAAQDGHFRVTADVGGAELPMMVDTGASVVVLTEEAARRAGIDVDGLAYTQPHITANGSVMAAPLRLERLSVGPITLYDVRAAVSPSLKGQSLLGMSWLGRLGGFTFEGDRMVLRP